MLIDCIISFSTHYKAKANFCYALASVVCYKTSTCIGVGSRGGEGGGRPPRFFGLTESLKSWSRVKAKALVFAWVIIVASLTQTIFLRQLVPCECEGVKAVK